MKRRWLYLLVFALVAVWVYHASRPGTRVEGCFTGCAPAATVNVHQIRVISLNMLHGFPSFDALPRRIERIAAEITRRQADIVLMQEVPWTLKTKNAARKLAELTGMNYAYIRANGNRWAIGFEEGEAILSRYPIRATDFKELLPRAGVFEHRIVLRATLDTSMGDIDVYTTHLTNGDPQINQQQAAALSAYTRGTNLGILAGDFNAEPQSSQIESLQSQWVDAFASSMGTQALNTCCIDDLTVRDQQVHKRIDYLFLSPTLAKPNHLEIQLVFDQPYPLDKGWLWVSDHFGLMVTMEPSSLSQGSQYQKTGSFENR